MEADYSIENSFFSTCLEIHAEISDWSKSVDDEERKWCFFLIFHFQLSIGRFKLLAIQRIEQLQLELIADVFEKSL